MAMSEEKKALIEKLKAHGYKESSVKRLSVEKLEKKLTVEDALAGAKANKKVVEDNVVEAVIEGTEVIEVVEGTEVIDPDFDMPEAKQCTGRNCTTTTGYDHSPECIEDYNEITKLEDEDAPEKKDFMEQVTEQAFEANEKEKVKKELYNEIQAAKKLAITHKYMFKARFLTLLDLGMTTGRPNMHFIQMSYMRMFPRPHASNYNGDIIPLHEKFTKYFTEGK